ncbi:MFS transporter [Caballeronia sp. LjRoot34]|uniref:MFS transporter n=1 Tax=Caballeronia sp. LjRoot34 TaxID=3342325 RepID=UPI003ECF70F2
MFRILFLSLGAFALGVDAYIMAGLLPGIAETFAVTPSGAGQTVSVFTVCYALSAPVFGALTAGQPVRRVLAVALVIFATANACSALAGSFSALLITRAVAGMGAGLFTPLAVSAAAALVTPERRGRAIGLVIGGLAMGTAIGVPSGLLLAQYAGWRGALWLIALLGVIALIGVAVCLPTVPVAPPPTLKQRISVLVDRKVAGTVLVSFLTAVGSIGLYTYVSAIFHVDAPSAGLLPYLWSWSLGGLIGTYFSGVVIDRSGRPEWVMVAMLASMSVAIILLYWTVKYPPLAVICFFIWGVAAWGSQAPQQHRLLTLRPRQGNAAVALHSSAHYLGSAVGAALGGSAIAAGVHVSSLPLLAAGVLSIVTAVQICIARSLTRKDT